MAKALAYEVYWKAPKEWLQIFGRAPQGTSAVPSKAELLWQIQERQRQEETAQRLTKGVREQATRNRKIGRSHEQALKEAKGAILDDPGLDIRSDGGNVVLPGSIHISGRVYEYEATPSPADVPLAPMPTWLVALLQPNGHRQPRPAPPLLPFPEQRVAVCCCQSKPIRP
jgi:hypothetical protein